MLLELSLWQGNLVEIDHDMEAEASLEAKPRKRAKIDVNGARQEIETHDLLGRRCDQECASVSSTVLIVRIEQTGY